MFLVDSELIEEAYNLLRISQPENCPKWKKGIGSCKEPDCVYCRMQKCINALDTNHFYENLDMVDNYYALRSEK